MHMRALHRFAMLIGVALSGAILPDLAAGQDTAGWKIHPYLQDRWNIQLGAFRPDVSTNARLDSATLGVGTSVSFEDDLRFKDRKTLGTFLASLRLGERWRIEGEYFSLSRDSTASINRTIQWGDTVFPVNTTVTASFDSDIYRLSGGYSFVKDGQRELGVALGLHATDFAASLGATGFATQARDALAPLPTIGVYGAYAVTPKWLLTGRLDYFSLNYDDYDGSLVNFAAGIEYRFSRHFGIGAGIRHVDYELGVTKTKYTGRIEYKFTGPTLFAVASF